MPSLPIDPDTPFFCRGCGYQLNQLSAPRCPECDRSFDPDDFRSVIMPDLESLLARVGEWVAYLRESPESVGWVRSLTALDRGLRVERLTFARDQMRRAGAEPQYIELIEALIVPPIFDAFVKAMDE